MTSGSDLCGGLRWVQGHLQNTTELHPRCWHLLPAVTAGNAERTVTCKARRRAVSLLSVFPYILSTNTNFRAFTKKRVNEKDR